MKPQTPVGISLFWDVYLPLGISSVPTIFFTLMQVAAKGLDRPGAKAEIWQIVSLIVFETIGIVAMAFVILTRVEIGMQQLKFSSGGHLSAWRRRTLLVSMGFLALFDLLLNLGVFTGDRRLIVIAVPLYLLYLLGIRLTFRALREQL